MWRALGHDIGPPAWRFMRHLVLLIHYLSDDVRGPDDVDNIRNCIRELQQVNSAHTRREGQGDRYLLHDIGVLEDLVAEIDVWQAEHPDVEVGEFQPQLREGEEVAFVDTNLVIWCRLSAGGHVDSLPVRLLEADGADLRVRSIPSQGLEVLAEDDFI